MNPEPGYLPTMGKPAPPTSQGFLVTDMDDIIDRVRDLSLQPGYNFSFTVTFKGKRQAARWFRKMKREIARRNAVVKTIPSYETRIPNQAAAQA